MTPEQDNGSNGHGPWNKKPRNSQQPPDLDELLKKLQKKMAQQFQGKSKGGSKTPAGDEDAATKIGPKLIWALVVLLVFWLIAGFFIVQPAERAAITRFGRYVATLGPGPHWIPPLIERRYIVNEEKVDTYSYSADMLTKDQTIVSVALSVQYRIGNARDYLFNVVSPVESLQQATASALRQVIGHSSLDEILTYGRSEIRQQVEQALAKILVRYQTGLEIVEVAMQPAKAPDQVKEAFDDAIKAQEDEQRLINQAQAYAMKIIPLAEGVAKRYIADAAAYKEKVILAATGETLRFSAVLNEYRKAPAVTRERIYLQTIEHIYKNANKVIMDNPQGQSFVYLPIDKLMKEMQEGASTEGNENTAILNQQQQATDQSLNVDKLMTTSMPSNELSRALIEERTRPEDRPRRIS